MRNFIFILALTISSIDLSFEATECDYGYQGKYCDQCGISVNTPNTKIIGGSIAVPNSWPALISLAYKGEHSCGGSLIDRETVMTAAHCVADDLSIKNYRVYVGAHNVNKYPGLSGVAVKSIHMHPKYDSKTELNDIAIIKLNSEVTLNETVQIACLPQAGFPPKRNVPVWAAGWGAISFPKPTYPDLLRNIKLTLYPFDLCRKVDPSSKKNWRTQLCAGDLKGGRDTCTGDSGGPLFVKGEVDNEEKYVVAGLVSYGEGCAKPKLPGIYTKVSAFLDWINNYLS